MIKFFPDMRTFLKIGELSIAWYAVLIISGAYIAYYLTLNNFKKMGYKSDDIESLFMGVLISGILGARLWYILFFDLSYYLSDPISILRIRDGGLAIHGGLVAGFIYLYFFTKRHHANFMHWMDAILPNVMVAQAIGRWGNFMNQEAYGGTVLESHFRFLPNFIKDGMFINGVYRAPTFLYESVLNIIGWILITQVLKKSKFLKRGDQSFAYLIWYGVIRFIIEGMRDDALIVTLGTFNIRVAQATSLIFLAIGIFGFYGGFKKFITKNKPVIMVDFDGTIMDTQEVIFKAYIEVFKKYKPELKITDDILYSFIGPTLYESFGRFFEEDMIETCVSEYRKINMALHPEYVKPIKNAKEVLTKLKDEGYSLCIVSSKLHEPIAYALDLVDMSDLFEGVYGMDNYEHVKPHPDGIITALVDQGYDRSQVIYIGDTKTDVEAGRNAGAYTIAYLYDGTREVELKESNPNALMVDWLELEDILKGNHEWTYNLI